MILKATPAMTGNIKDIWKKCFAGEDPRYTEYFFRSLYQPSFTLVDLQHDRPVASLCRIPHALMFNGRVLQTSMIVGVATLPEERHHGSMHALMNTVLDACEHTELITLIQAYEPKMYEPFGFRMVYYRTEYLLSRKEVKRITNYGCAYEPSPIDMLKVYSAFIRRFNGFYARDLDYFAAYKKEINARGGKIVAYYNGKNQIQGYASMIPDGRDLDVEECVYLDSLSLMKLCNAALQERSAVHLHVSEAEDLSKLFPGAKHQTYGSTMVRLNDAALFSRLFGVQVNSVEEAFATGRKPLNLNEFA